MKRKVRTKNRATTGGLVATVIGFALFAGSCATFLLWEDECMRVVDPSGNYIAIATYPRYQSFLVMAPGGGGDKSGFVKIVDQSGRSYGKRRVDFVSMVRDIEWLPGAAEIKFAGAWDLRAAHDREKEEIGGNER